MKQRTLRFLVMPVYSFWCIAWIATGIWIMATGHGFHARQGVVVVFMGVLWGLMTYLISKFSGSSKTLLAIVLVGFGSFLPLAMFPTYLSVDQKTMLVRNTSGEIVSRSCLIPFMDSYNLYPDSISTRFPSPDGQHQVIWSVIGPAELLYKTYGSPQAFTDSVQTTFARIGKNIRHGNFDLPPDREAAFVIANMPNLPGITFRRWIE